MVSEELDELEADENLLREIESKQMVIANLILENSPIITKILIFSRHKIWNVKTKLLVILLQIF